MTDDLGRTEDALRSVLAARAGEVPPPVGLYPAVRRQARQRRTVLGAGAAVAVVAAGVPVTLGALGASAGRPTPGPAATGTAPAAGGCVDTRRPHPPVEVPPLPRQPDVRGSLGDDPATVQAVLTEGFATLLTSGPDGRPAADLVPASARVLLAERAAGQILGLVAASGSSGYATAWVVGPDATHLRGHWSSSGDTDAEIAATYESTSVVVCDREFAVLMVTPGSTGRISWISDVTAAGEMVRTSAAVPLRPDGTAVFPTPPGPRQLTLNGRPAVLSGVLASGPKRFPTADVERAVAAAPGAADATLVRDLVYAGGNNSLRLPLSDLRVLWKGTVGDSSVAVSSVRFPSGASYVWTAWNDGSESDTGYGGVLRAGALDRTVFASVLTDRPGKPLLVVASEGVRAEIVRGDAVEVVNLSGGGVVVPNGAGVTIVRVYDAAGRLIEERAPDTGLVPIA